jgi:hypothetical protein
MPSSDFQTKITETETVAQEPNEEKQTNDTVRSDAIDSDLTIGSIDANKAAAQKEMDESLAKLAKLVIEQKKIDATLALVRKIKSPSLRAKTLTDLATYIAHDPNFKYEAQVLFKEATIATLALDELELDAVPELKELTTITATKTNTPTQPPAIPVTTTTTTPVKRTTPTTVPTPTPSPTLPDDVTTIPEQIESTPAPKPQVATPKQTVSVSKPEDLLPPIGDPTPAETTTTTTPPVVVPPTTTTNPDIKTNVPQRKPRSMPGAAAPPTVTPLPTSTPPKPAVAETLDDDVTLEPKRTK